MNNPNRQQIEEAMRILNNLKPLLGLHPKLSTDAIFSAINAIQTVQEVASKYLKKVGRKK